jgi:20S proteasome alpha/beta subunit
LIKQEKGDNIFIMTVCIAGLANNDRGVILASDKMISKQMPPIEYEHEIDKIVQVFPNFYVLIAGTVNNAVDIVEKAKSSIKEADPYYKKFDKFKEAYTSYRKGKIEDVILGTQGFSSIIDFQQRQNSLNKEVVMNIQNLIANANLQTLMILVALENHKCYVKVLNHPGDLINPLEYAVIGSGDLHATQSLISARYKKSEDVDTATYLVFEAKKRAEVAPGVGVMTDMIVLYYDDKEELIYKKLTDEELSKLDEVYKDVNLRDPAMIQAKLKEKSFHI